MSVFPTSGDTSVLNGTRFYILNEKRNTHIAQEYLGYSGDNYCKYEGTVIVPSMTSGSTFEPDESKTMFYNGIFGAGSGCMFHDKTHDIMAAINSPSGSTWDNFVNEVKSYDNAGTTGYYHVIAVYDPWTVVGITGEGDYGMGLVDRTFENVYQYITPDTNAIGLVRLYRIKKVDN
jgi:hypothetical protein